MELRKFTKALSIATILFAATINHIHLKAQTDSCITTIHEVDTLYTIGNIEISGNKKTKPDIILCEMLIKSGDTIRQSQLHDVLEQCKINLQKISIFNYVTINYEKESNLNNDITIYINVEERWYIWPAIDIMPHNGNLNEWLSNPDIHLIDYYIGIKKYNFRGRRETITFAIRRGFNNLTQINYENIALNKKRNHLLSFSVFTQSQKSVMLNTLNNQATYADFKGTKKAASEYNFNISYHYRTTIDMKNTFQLGYFSSKICDSVAILNPNFLGSGRTHISGLTLQYRFSIDKRNSSYYPLQGSMLTTTIKKLGVFSNTIDTYTLILDARKYIQLKPRLYFSTQLYISNSSESMPFHKMEMLGATPNIMPGYEHNMIAGHTLGYIKTSYKYELLRTRVVHLKWLKFNKFNKIHYAIYLNTFANAGYTSALNDDTIHLNPMNNAFLGSLGIGLDLVTYYDRLFSVYITRNYQGKSYVGIGFKTSF